MDGFVVISLVWAAAWPLDVVGVEADTTSVWPPRVERRLSEAVSTADESDLHRLGALLMKEAGAEGACGSSRPSADRVNVYVYSFWHNTQASMRRAPCEQETSSFAGITLRPDGMPAAAFCARPSLRRLRVWAPGSGAAFFTLLVTLL